MIQKLGRIWRGGRGFSQWMHVALRGMWWRENIQKWVPWEKFGITRLSHCFSPVFLFTVWFRCWTMLHFLDHQHWIFKWELCFAVCNRKKRLNININHHQSTSLQQFPLPRAKESNPFYNSFKRSKQRCVPWMGGHWWWKTTPFGGEINRLKIEWSCDPIVFSKKVANFWLR